jgi:betaine-aldehyde dehydrogenase
MLSLQKLYIDGQSSDATSGEVFGNFSPSTGAKICDVQIASASDIDRAVQSCEKGFRKWSSMSGNSRHRIMMEAARIIRRRTQELAELEVLDSGKPISEALLDIPGSAEAIEYFAGLAQTLHGHHYDFGKQFVYTRREPLGVCAGIGAWNYPFQIACWKSAPALACGNSMIFKPSELTPLTAMKLAEIYLEAGVPEGVFNVVQGTGKVGQWLSEHPGIQKISLTGSLPTGRRVMAAAAQSLKHITLELGGKSPLILFEDCKIDRAVTHSLMANFYTQGEICSNGTRVFVQESILDAFLDQLVPRVNQIKVGNPLDPKTEMGALISRAHLNKVKNYVEKGVAEGAKLLCGGEFPKWNSENRVLENGNFITPAVFIQCRDEMTHVKEEIFGPVMSILTFKDEKEVIARANHTDYGLAAGVFTQNLGRAHRVIAALQAGTCWINSYNVTPVEVPFGGYKQSGIGRENGLTTLEHYTQLKTVYVETGDSEEVNQE